MKRSRWIFAVCGLMLSGHALASTTGPGYITTVEMFGNGVVAFDLSGTRSSLPACQSSGLPARWALDASTAIGQARLALLLTAYAAHKPIQIAGTEDCSVYGVVETVNYFNTNDP